MKKNLEELAEETGFIKRKRKVTAKDFLILMTFGLLGMRFPSLAGMVDASKLKLSREALHQKFTKEAVIFMRSVLVYLLNETLKHASRLESSVLDNFTNIFIIDSTCWKVSDALEEILPGFNNRSSRTNSKLQAVYELKKGLFTFFDVMPGKVTDIAYVKEFHCLIKKGNLFIMDLGYFSMEFFKEINDAGAYFISRLFIGRQYLFKNNLEPIKLEKLVHLIKTDNFEMEVLIGSSKKNIYVPSRLIVMRLSEEIAKERRRRHLYKCKHQRRGNARELNLEMCGWTVMVTNVPKKILPANLIYPFYRLRWQIELTFKQFKSILQIDKGDTGNINRFMCEVYGKLITAVLVHYMHTSINNRVWSESKRELSFEKLWKRIQERAFKIMELLFKSFRLAIKFLEYELKYLEEYCIKFKQRSRQSSLEAIHIKPSHFKQVRLT